MNTPPDPIVADAYARHQQAMQDFRDLSEEERKTAKAPAWSDAVDAANAAIQPAPPVETETQP